MIVKVRWSILCPKMRILKILAMICMSKAKLLHNWILRIDTSKFRMVRNRCNSMSHHKVLKLLNESEKNRFPLKIMFWSNKSHKIRTPQIRQIERQLQISEPTAVLQMQDLRKLAQIFLSKPKIRQLRRPSSPWLPKKRSYTFKISSLHTRREKFWTTQKYILLEPPLPKRCRVVLKRSTITVMTTKRETIRLCRMITLGIDLKSNLSWARALSERLWNVLIIRRGKKWLWRLSRTRRSMCIRRELS